MYKMVYWDSQFIIVFIIIVISFFKKNKSVLFIKIKMSAVSTDTKQILAFLRRQGRSMTQVG